MRYGLILALIGILLLAGCAGTPSATPAPTEAPQIVTEVATAPAPVEGTPDLGDNVGMTPRPTLSEIEQEIQSFIVATIPPPGTLVVPTLATEEPVSLLFDSLVFTMEGGPSAAKYRTELYADGRLVRDGVTSQVSPDDVTKIDAMIDAINFFNIEGQFTSPNLQADDFQYSLTINRVDANRTLFAQDGLLPPELKSLFAAINDLGRPGRPQSTPAQ